MPLVTGAGALLVVISLATALSIADFGESAGREEGVTLRDVTDDPRHYAGETVTISGEYAQTDYFSPDDADLVLVIGDDAGRHLLVLPQPQAGVPPGIDEDTVLRVTGVVRVVEPGGDEGLLSQGGLLAQAGAEAMIEATDVSYANDEPSPTQPTRAVATVAQVLDEPRAFSDSIVRVPGRAYRLGERGFVLAGSQRAVFVGAPASELRAIAAGERILVDAEVARISPFRADVIADVLERAGGDKRVPGIDRIPRRPGDPYLVLRGIAGA